MSLKIIEKAKQACENSGISTTSCFVDVNKTLRIPLGGEKTVSDYILTRYACYLIVQNGDPQKEIIALGQTYFAVKTRQQELIDNYESLTEDQKRLSIRSQKIEHNSH